MALEASARFWEEFPCNTSFPTDVKSVLDGSIGILGSAEGEDHEGSALAFETAFNWFDPTCEEDGFRGEVIDSFDFGGRFNRRVKSYGHVFDDAGEFPVFDL